MHMLDRYLERIDFSSYEDFVENFRLKVPEQFNFAYDVVDEYARLDPQRIALVWCDDHGDRRTITFGELKYFSDKVANYLKSLGLRKGDPVMLILKRRYEYWFCLIALHKLGAVAIPATHLLTARDIEHRNMAASTVMTITVDDERVIQHVDDAQAHSPTLKWKISLQGQHPGWLSLNDGMASASADFARPTGDDATRNSDRLLLYFTSGTTGMPKMVDHDQTYPLGHILTAKYWQQVVPGGLHLTVADTGWAKAAWGKIYGQWLAGSAVFVYDLERFNAQRLLQVLEEFKVTTFCAPPTIYRMLVQEDVASYTLDSLAYVCAAGEPLNPETIKCFYEQTGLLIREGFGQTETVVALASYPWFTPKLGSMGKPSPLYRIDLLNDDGESAKPGEHGQIVIHTDGGKPIGMFNGYYRDEALTNLVWEHDIYYTGDVAWRDEDGYYWFVGRADDLIKTSGYRVSPFEVESVLLEHPAVVECAVTGIPDEDRGQVIKATVVLSGAHAPGDEVKRALQEHVKNMTAPYKYPRIIEFVTELPKTVSGKILRRILRQTPAEGEKHQPPTALRAAPEPAAEKKP